MFRSIKGRHGNALNAPPAALILGSVVVGIFLGYIGATVPSSPYEVRSAIPAATPAAMLEPPAALPCEPPAALPCEPTAAQLLQQVPPTPCDPTAAQILPQVPPTVPVASSNSWDLGFLMSADSIKGETIMWELGERETIQNNVLVQLKEMKTMNPQLTVLDIGCSFVAWDKDYITVCVDINKPTPMMPGVTFIQGQAYDDQTWQKIFDHVAVHGKFDVFIASQTYEDLAYPQLLMNRAGLIAKTGWIGVPTWSAELEVWEHGAANLGLGYIGWIHHRWMWTILEDTLWMMPKLGSLQFNPKVAKVKSTVPKLETHHSLGYWWAGKPLYMMLNNDFMGPSVDAVLDYHADLFAKDDLQRVAKYQTPHFFHNVQKQSVPEYYKQHIIN